MQVSQERIQLVIDHAKAHMADARSTLAFAYGQLDMIKAHGNAQLACGYLNALNVLGLIGTDEHSNLISECRNSWVTHYGKKLADPS